MKTRAILALAVAAGLAGCVASQSTPSARVVAPTKRPPVFSKIGDGPPLAQALAYCRIQSRGAEQGYWAVGSTAYVAGAAIGNAIGNAIRVDQFMRDCMILAGWQKNDPRARWQVPPQ